PRRRMVTVYLYTMPGGRFRQGDVPVPLSQGGRKAWRVGEVAPWRDVTVKEVTPYGVRASSPTPSGVGKLAPLGFSVPGPVLHRLRVHGLRRRLERQARGPLAGATLQLLA